MIRFVVVMHNHIAQQMSKTLQDILREVNTRLLTLEVGPEDAPELVQRRIRHILASFPSEDHVVLLTDLFGATPSNVCRGFVQKGHVALLSGCNLPILVKAATTCFTESPEDVATFLSDYGRESIRISL